MRIGGFIYTAPFYGLKNVPVRVKVGFSVLISIILMTVLPYEPLSYTGVIGFALLIAGETLAGVVLGFLANIVYQILAFSGQLLDLEIGFSMVNEMDPVTSAQVTVSGNFYSYAVMLMLMITYMHHYLIEALIDTYKIIPLGQVAFNPLIYTVAAKFMAEYFILAFRIILPVFAAMLIVNTILAILAKVAPQMSLFVIGVQLKVLIGLAVMVIMIKMLPGISELIFGKMMEMIRDAINYMQ
ncbi:MAG: flagellar biosynthetic protein FliR [Lachnospiraceae bacterium]|nr:flagellar biosynthetic protein FliR [Lachnospiraceae bacterium]